MILTHEIVDRFVEQTGVGERGADAAAFFRRTVAQCIVDERGGLIGIEFVKIADGFLANFGRWIVERLCDLVERTVQRGCESQLCRSYETEFRAATLDQFFCRAS